ncbi:MAG TPA: SDR family oxidoreductase [Allosphingosinicella sp.]|nr:SDR family oxidoreductase [Allosphingosinicella sp.]
MQILILGGSLFVGRAIAEAALARGHAVTLFNRGLHGQPASPDVEEIRGDRDGGLDGLRGRSWDAVVDTSGYVPRLVRASAELLAANVKLYVFVSSISVYADFSEPVDERSAIATTADETIEEVTGATYGPLKALSEQAVEQAMPGRGLIIRPGVIVGPHDPTIRFSYWTSRVLDGGEVLAPGEPETPVQFIDVRDLAAWMIRLVEAGQTGTFNATGPEQASTMGALLEACRAAAGNDARFTWVDEAFLAAHGVEPGTHLPLWIPPSRQTYSCFFRTGIDRALAAGLAFRPLVETISDTLAWQRAHGTQPLPEKFGVPMPDLTLSRERERKLLEDFHGLAH